MHHRIKFVLISHSHFSCILPATQKRRRIPKTKKKKRELTIPIEAYFCLRAMNLISAHTQKPLRCASLSIIPSSFNFPSQFPSPSPLLNSTLYSAKLATTNGDGRRNFMSPVVAKASTSSGYGPGIGESLGDVRIFTAAGEPVLFKDLWDQKEVKSLPSYVCFIH